VCVDPTDDLADLFLEADLVEAPHTTGTKEHNEESKADHVVPFVNLRDLCVRSL
jgi:hypothetical protein